MKILKSDKFVSDVIGYKSFISFHKISESFIEKIKPPFFITIKSKKKLNYKIKNKRYFTNFNSKLVNLERKFKKNVNVYVNCRLSQNKDKNQLLKIVNKKNLNSRFIKDKYLSKKFKNNFKKKWILNYFRKKRGDFLIVAYTKKTIMGFILLIKKKSYLRIDLIQTKSKFQKRKVASSLINFVNNNYLLKNQKIVAGTQDNNIEALKMYKNLGFKKYRSPLYIYHIHNKKFKSR